MLTKRFKQGMAILLLLLLLLPITAFAANAVSELPRLPGTQSGDQVTLPPEETIEGPLFYSGQNVQINGNVEGTAFATGYTIDVNGRIDGDLFVAGQDVTVRGEVTGNIYGAAQSLQIDNETHGDIFAGGQTIKITDAAKAHRDVFIGGATVSSDGLIGRYLFTSSESVNLGGNIGRDVFLSANAINLKDGTVIEGDFNYESRNQMDIPAGVTIAGEQNWSALTRSTIETAAEEQPQGFSRIILKILFSLISATLIWLVIELIRPRFWNNFVDPLLNTPVKTIGLGLLAALVLIPLVLLMSITVIGIPGALLLVVISVLLTALAKIITAAALSRLVIDRFNFPRLHLGIWSFMLIYLAIIILARLPYLGVLLNLICIFIAFGIVVLHLFISPYRTTRNSHPSSGSGLPPSPYTDMHHDQT